MPGAVSQKLGSLYLIPNLLGVAALDASLPAAVATTVSMLKHFLVEDEKNARAFIKKVAPTVALQQLDLRRLSEHTKPDKIHDLMLPLQNGSDIGIISEAGCPGVADPGSIAVRYAHFVGARVVPLVGPCSMLLALMASGLNGQRWRFHGYLPIEAPLRTKALTALERDARELQETQIFMDTPYRNQRLLQDILSACSPDTLLCIASSLTTEAESVRLMSIESWRADEPILPKEPTLFLLGA
jgi:16S rRNA (cytidine1402-2'-O)-methyltransferase